MKQWDEKLDRQKSQTANTVSAIEQMLSCVPANSDVLTWNLRGLDLWPLFTTSLLSLAVLIDIRHKKWGISVGRGIWRAGVLLDYFLISRLRKQLPVRQLQTLPLDDLDGKILYVASKVHTRMFDNVLVCAPLDIPATLMHRSGYEGVMWYEDIEANDGRLFHALNSPARGVYDILRTAHKQAFQPGTRRCLRKIEGFNEWCMEAANCLGLSSDFLEIWLARQVNIAVSTSEHYGKVFDSLGHPSLIVMLNSGFATTTGLAVAGSSKQIPIVEVQHGAESKSAITAFGQIPHFSNFNSTPDGMISWECEQRDDGHVLAMGPIGLLLPAVFSQKHEADQEGHKILCQQLQVQKSALDNHVQHTAAEYEILVSLQPNDNAAWLRDVVQELPNCLFWIRRHGADLNKITTPSEFDVPTIDANCVEFTLATQSALPLILERVDLHLTRFSAVTLEAAAYGVPTLATSPYALELYERQISNELLSVVSNISDLSQAIRDRIGKNINQKQGNLGNMEQIEPFLDHYIHQL